MAELDVSVVCTSRATTRFAERVATSIAPVAEMPLPEPASPIVRATSSLRNCTPAAPEMATVPTLLPSPPATRSTVVSLPVTASAFAWMTPAPPSVVPASWTSIDTVPPLVRSPATASVPPA